MYLDSVVENKLLEQMKFGKYLNALYKTHD